MLSERATELFLIRLMRFIKISFESNIAIIIYVTIYITVYIY